MTSPDSNYIPAAGHARLTALYDPVLSLTMRERAFRGRLVAQVLERGLPGRILDLGTGTGSLAIALARAAPLAQIVGLDPDPGALERARAKAGSELSIEWMAGRCEQIPYADGAFDALSCSLMFHHLQPAAKRHALGECLRVLKPGGWLHIADWGPAHDPLLRLAFLGVQLLDGFACTREHARGALPGLIAASGFNDVQVRDRLRTCWGSLELISAQRGALAAPGSPLSVTARAS